MEYAHWSLNSFSDPFIILGLEESVAHTTCRLEPSTIILTPPTKNRDLLFLKSGTNQQLQYQVNCYPEGVEVNPKRGLLNPGQETIIHLKYPKILANFKSHKILVSVGNEVYESLVKIKTEF